MEKNKTIKMEEEVWKPIPNYETSHEVSNLGRIRALKRVVIRTDGVRQPIEQQILKLQICKDGYLAIGFRNFGKQKRFQVHRLVALAFIPNPNNLRCVNHIDGNKSNNNLYNLEWCTHAENTHHSIHVLKTQNPYLGENHNAIPIIDTISNKSYNSIKEYTDEKNINYQYFIRRLRQSPNGFRGVVYDKI